MSLLRLLTAGRSLVGGSNSEPHYRMSDPKAMPKFGSAKNPFRPKESRENREAMQAPDGAASEVGRGIPAAAMPEASRAAGLREAEAPLTAKRPEGRAPAASAAAAKLGWLQARSRRLWSWLSRSRPAEAKPAVPRFDTLPIQGELALDRIKVVRNDLSDADLEVVSRAPAAPAKASAAPAVKAQPELVPVTVAASTPAPKPGVARTAWNRAGRLLGAMKT